MEPVVSHLVKLRHSLERGCLLPLFLEARLGVRYCEGIAEVINLTSFRCPLYTIVLCQNTVYCT